jgi:PKD repeat protein
VAAAINAYLAGKSGLVDVPIRIFVAPDLEVKLYDSNITVQPAVDLAAGGLGVGGAVAASGSSAATYLEGDSVAVQATLSNPSSKASGPVTAAFFATAAGWGDWYIGSAFVANIPAGGSAPVSILWDTTGFNGVVSVKVVVNPYGRTGETSTTNNTATTQVSITPLNPPPAVDFTATPTLGGAPLSVQFTSLVTNTVTTYAWDFGDGQSSSAAQPAHSYSAAGVYTVTLTVSGPGGSATKRRSSCITVTNTPTSPTAAFSASPTTGAAPLTVSFTNQSTGTITGYTWSFGDGQSSSAANPSHQYTAPGVYTVALTASGAGGSAVETKSGYITVQAAPVAAFSASPMTGAAPLPVQFTDASTGTITGWQWSFGDGGQSSEQHPAHTYQTPGGYTVTLTVSGPGGAHSTATALRVTLPLPTFSADPPAAGGLTVPFAFTPPPGVTHWLWDFGDGQTSTEQNPVHTYAAPGGYTVRLTVYGPGEVSASQELIVTVRADVPNPAGYSLYLPNIRQ